MSHSTSYPSPPYSHPDMDTLPTQSLLASTWHVLEQPPPPTLREILNAYRSKGDGDRDMLLAMLNAKTAEDQRISAVASLHQRMLDVSASLRPPIHDNSPSYAHSSAVTASEAHPGFHPPPLPRISPTASPKDITLPSIHPSTYPRKRARTSRSPPGPMNRHHSGSHPLAPSEQLPPSPPFSSPGRSASSADLHPQPRTMAIGSLLSPSSAVANSHHDPDTEWPSRMSAERTGTAAKDRDGHTK